MGKLSDFNLSQWVNTHKVFVESGTGRGDGLRYAMGHNFSHLYSTEIVTDLFNHLVPDFAADSRVKLFNMHAPEFLDSLFANYVSPSEPIVYFSDAHYPASDVYGVPFDSEKDIDKRLPLQKELEVFKKHGRKNDVIIVDDLRIYRRCPSPVHNLDDIGLGHIAQYNDARFVYDLFEETHNIQEIYADTGYLLIVPKTL